MFLLPFTICDICTCSAHSGDETGSDYLQAFAALLQEKYQELPLDRIYLMVKQYMTKIKKVGLQSSQVHFSSVLNFRSGEKNHFFATK